MTRLYGVATSSDDLDRTACGSEDITRGKGTDDACDRARLHTMAEHDDDWDDDWNDGQDVTPFVPAEQAAPARPGPATSAGHAPPAYSDGADDADDFGMLAPPPVDEFAERPTVARSRNRPSRARSVSQSGRGEQLDPVELDEPMADEPEPMSKPGRGCFLASFGAIVLILAVIVIVMVKMGPLAGLLGDDSDGEIAMPPASSSMSASQSPTTQVAPVKTAADAADEECAISPRGAEVGNGPGSRDSGPEVIMAFDHAYYVDRNGTKARGFMSEDLTGTTAQSLQGAIDELPEDTAHCLKIRPKEDEEDVFLVDLIVFRGEGDQIERTASEQTIYVEEVDGEYTIVGIINPE